ncbi:MAG: DNA-processing protein DprA [Clostridiales bacterium]|nr:DNA-processing protein DprA [Clostridiales bacterium]
MVMNMSDLKYWIWLSELFSRGSDKPNALLDEFDTPERIFHATEEELARTEILGKDDIARVMRHSLDRSEYIEKECEKLKISIVVQSDTRYPKRLKRIYGAPVLLYVYGNIADIDDEVVIGVVGTREPSEYGTQVTNQLCYELANSGVIIVSGCAVGIDANAHLGAVKAGKRTIAVLGCGLDINYPAANHQLKRQILLNGGALISELPPGTTVNGHYFPTRNRIIAGLSLGVLVTEAPRRSGSIISLNHALEQGRDTFCIPPHDIYDPRYRGVVVPLRDYAKAVYDANDILFEYYNEYSHKLTADKVIGDYMRQIAADRSQLKQVADESAYQTSDAVVQEKPISPDGDSLGLTGNKLIVYNALDDEPQYINEITVKADMPLQTVLSTITELEIDGFAVSYSGQRYGRVIKQ